MKLRTWIATALSAFHRQTIDFKITEKQSANT
jgi:hypothetical protein